MRIAKLSLVCAAALGMGSGLASAKTIEEAIKGIEYNGMLRYRLNSDSYDNKGAASGVKDTTTTHQYRAVGNFATEPIKNISAHLGVAYINEGASTSTGSSGTNLGAGYDGNFGVQSFYLKYAPKDVSTTTITAGKFLLDTPLTDPGDYDRGTGVIATNNDIKGLKLIGAFVDTWTLSNMFGYGDSTSISKPVYGLAGVYTIPNMLTAQLWWFQATDIVKNTLLGAVDYNQNFGNFGARAGAWYAMATLDTNPQTQFTGLGGPYVGTGLFEGQEANNDLLKLTAGATFGPGVIDVGYFMNTKPGYSVSFDDQGAFFNTVTMGQLWWQNSATKTSIGIGRRSLKANDGSSGSTAWQVAEGGKDKLSVITASVGAKNIANTGVGVHLTYVKGSSEYTNDAQPGTNFKREFQEITPLLNYAYSESLSFQTFYAMLSTDVSSDTSGSTVTEKRNRYRFQALYKF